MRRLAVLLLLVPFLFFGCHSSTQSKAVKKEKKTEPEYVGDNTAPTEVRALRDAHQLQKDMNKKQEEEKDILKQRD